MTTTTLNGTHSDVNISLQKAHDIASWWDEIGFTQRRSHLLRWCAAISNNARDLARLCHRETGKPIPTGVLEISLAVNSVMWAARSARRILGQKRLPTKGIFREYTNTLCYRPYGTVGIIGSTDLPLYAGISSIGYALAGGNSVVYKPSEYAPATGQALARLFQYAAPNAPVLQLVNGDGQVGQQLCQSSVDAVLFIGSETIGQSIMADCAKNLTPAIMQCGGKDSMIVDADANADRAAAAAVYAAFSGSGQAAVGIQRAWAHAEVYDAFLRRVTQRADRLTVSDDPWADLGPMTKHERCGQLRTAMDEALAAGATAVIGGPDEINPPYAPPSVLIDVPTDARLLTDEIPGPVLCISKVDSIREAITLAHSTSGGIASSVFSKKNAAHLARTSRTGMTAVNSGLAWATQPTLPFGGMGGLGRVGGDDGLRALAQPKATSRPRWSPLRSPLLFSTDGRKLAEGLIRKLGKRFGRQ
ncbi:aldehyde dehydrogenase family protein [Haloglycomyces albus]|uniref:aldehyde dehydrogenase family protein n=1 Tax=Haloglycomyces albus TaxID=526067 RepID=UPI00046CE5E8|nr:aldehyde dehydrogenase family protein [Haloglycomyces albus]